LFVYNSFCVSGGVAETAWSASYKVSAAYAVSLNNTVDAILFYLLNR